MKIQNRVRRTLETSVLKEKSVTSEGWLFAIYAEAHLDARSMNVWGVRNLFDRAVENPRYVPLSFPSNSEQLLMLSVPSKDSLVSFNLVTLH